jgi:hypothetical protein
VVVVDGSWTIVGPGRAAVVVVDLPITRPRCDRPPAEQAAVASVKVAATPRAAVFRRAGLFMGDWSTFPADLWRYGVETLGMAYTSARESQGVHW